MAASITIRFIRNQSKKNDDKVFIHRTNLKNQYTLSHYFAGYPVKVRMSDKDVFRWLRNTIRLLKYDTVDPFLQFQIDYPMMPSVLIDMTKLQMAYTTILDCLEFHLNYWMSLHEESDSDSDTDSDAESEGDDNDSMPPLVPIEQKPVFVVSGSGSGGKSENVDEYADMPPLERVPHGSHHLFLDGEDTPIE
jgi:hypothetical protein